MIVLMLKDYQNGGRTMFELWQPMGNFYELRQYTRQYQNLQEQTVFNNQLHALEHAMFKSKR
jgi:hypothetical protein